MTRTVYLNGEFVAEHDAKVSVFDRGFLFADAVYEVSAVLNGRLLDNAAHLARCICKSAAATAVTVIFISPAKA